MTKRGLAVAASMLVTLVLGSVHAFSVFLLPLESLLHLPRSEISLIYSLALVALTLAVLCGYRIYGLLPAWWLVLLTCLASSSGLLLASIADSWWLLFIGYSLLFGFSNGVGYGFCLQLAARVMPDNKGLAMGAVTAAYAIGSILFAKVFAWRIAVDSVASALFTLAVAVLVCGCLAALILRLVDARYAREAQCPATRLDGRKLLQFWLAYMSSVFAGLMAIGHAAGIAYSRDAGVELATLAAITIGIGSAAGGFVAGGLADRWPVTRLLVGLPLLSALALAAISFTPDAPIVVALLSLVGFSYGSSIAIYPVAIARYFGELGPKAYGRIFTAWGFAGLLAPWSAGLIYDLQAGYNLALLIAAAIALASALAAAGFELEQSVET